MRYVLLLAALVAGCGGGTRPDTAPRYQLVAGGQGNAWRLDTLTGTVWVCQSTTIGAGCQEVKEPDRNLRLPP